MIKQVCGDRMKVEFNMENIKKCICNTCPVQEDSQCAQNKEMKIQKMMPKPEMVPRMYCATGKATCDDIDTSKMCQCATCPVWKENQLAMGEPMGYFCRDGEAQ